MPGVLNIVRVTITNVSESAIALLFRVPPFPIGITQNSLHIISGFSQQ